ncbi:MAG: glutathione synthase [Gammaproteobacteria bacterium]
MRLIVVMDPIAGIDIKKDSTFAMLLAAQRRGWEIVYCELADLVLEDGRALAHGYPLQVWDDKRRWFDLGDPSTRPLAEAEVVLMRKDPPYNMEYIYATHLLDLAEADGALVVNAPRGLRDANEKLYTAWFPECCPPTVVTRGRARIRAFLERERDIVLKPLDGMGGASVFRVRVDDPNTNVIIETLTGYGQRYTMAQRYIPEISAGDKRILLIDGKPVPYALARIPAPGETRGNLAAGGIGKGVALGPRDYWICEQVGTRLRDKGLLFVGLDVIGDYLTEINVTSPTCIRELDALYGLDIAGRLLDAIERRQAER